MEDLHKDIETIWRELQEIDKLTQSSAGDGENRWVFNSVKLLNSMYKQLLKNIKNIDLHKC